MIILRHDVETMEWVPIEVETQGSLFRVQLNEDQVLEFHEEQDGKGLRYLAVRTQVGVLAIYPKSSNVVLFRVVNV